MKRASRLLLPLLFLGCSLHAQVPSGNALIDLFDLPYKDLLHLRTDSLFVRIQDISTGTVTRGIAYTYGDDAEEAIDVVEIRKENNGLQRYRISRHTEAAANGKIVETEQLDSLTMQVSKDRLTTIGSEPSRPDSVFYELWDGTQWRPVQKTYFQYNQNKMVVRQSESRWENAGTVWSNQFYTDFSYNGSNRITQIKNGGWANDAWGTQNIYRYSYNTSADNPAQSTVWQSSSTLIDSLVEWFDGQGLKDSSLQFYRDPYGMGWNSVTREVFSDAEQKKAALGNRYRKNEQGAWTLSEENTFTPGPATYTDQPQEVLTRIYDAANKEGKDVRRKTSAYELLADGRIHGNIQIYESQDGADWTEVFFAEAWFKLLQFRPDPDSVADRSDTFTFSYTCGLNNPYVQNQTLAFPTSDATGDYELRILSEDGRLVFQQHYDSSGLGTVSAPLPPGFYIVSVHRGSVPLCTQKLIVR